MVNLKDAYFKYFQNKEEKERMHNMAIKKLYTDEVEIDYEEEYEYTEEENDLEDFIEEENNYYSEEDEYADYYDMEESDYEKDDWE